MQARKSYPWALVMTQPDALPGSYLNRGKTLEEIRREVHAEVDMVARMGFDLSLIHIPSPRDTR